MPIIESCLRQKVDGFQIQKLRRDDRHFATINSLKSKNVQRPIEELMDDLKHDSFRRDHPFSSEMKNFQERMFASALTRAEKADILIEWLSSTNYPCLFGRKAAKASSVSVLILEERDLLRADKEIEGLIRDARSDWREQARTGRKHALVILAVSEQLAYAEPDTTVLEITRRLCEMYLGRSARADVVYRDELFLEIEGESPFRIR